MQAESAGISGAGKVLVPPAVPRAVPALALAVLSGVLVALSFPDWNLDLLVWVALAPLFLAARGAGDRRGFLIGWAAGITLEGMGFYWIFTAIHEFTGFTGWLTPVAVIFFLAWLLYSSLSWGLLGWFLGRCRSPGWVLAAIPFWVGVEHYYPRLFPWHLGGAHFARDRLRQAADLLGTSGLTYLVLLGSGLVYLGIEWRRGRARFPRWTLGIAALLLAGTAAYGAWRLREVAAEIARAPELRVGIFQPFVQPEVKSAKNDPEARFFFDLLARTAEMARERAPDLILWPEGADYPFPFQPGGDPLAKHRLRNGRTVFDGIRVPLVAGGWSSAGEGRHWNTAAYILPPGDRGAGAELRVQLYHKNHRLLFGEKVPFEDWLPQSIREKVTVGTIEAGTDCPLLSLRAAGGSAHHFRILICYEATLPGFVRRTAADADFLANVTEDIWYGRTPHTRQHESVLMLRAVENRIPIARCANVGPSGVIDAAGRFRESTAPFQSVEAMATLRPGSFFSLYRAGGYLFPAACLAAGLLVLLQDRLRAICGRIALSRTGRRGSTSGRDSRA